MKLFDIPSSLYISDVIHHSVIKDEILEKIASMGKYSMIQPESQSISNTDWHLDKSNRRPYYDIVEPIINNHNEEIRELLGYSRIRVINYWHQQYETGDYHGWHNHPACVFSNVYYVSLSGDNPSTTFSYLGKEFSVPVQEGMILTFPGYLLHKSGMNNSEQTKTVIAWNSDCERL